MTSLNKFLSPFIFLFLLFNSLLFSFKGYLANWGLQFEMLLVSNFLFFIISLILFFIQKKALKDSNPNVFIRSIMGGMLLKMFVCTIAVAIYVIVFKDSFSKNSILLSMFLYLTYLGVEVFVATKLNKQQNV